MRLGYLPEGHGRSRANTGTETMPFGVDSSRVISGSSLSLVWMMPLYDAYTRGRSSKPMIQPGHIQANPVTKAVRLLLPCCSEPTRAPRPQPFLRGRIADLAVVQTSLKGIGLARKATAIRIKKRLPNKYQCFEKKHVYES